MSWASKPRSVRAEYWIKRFLLALLPVAAAACAHEPTGVRVATPAGVRGLTFQTVSAGYLHTCGVTTAGAIYCWGDNSEGELGNGSLAGGSVTPVPVSGP